MKAKSVKENTPLRRGYKWPVSLPLAAKRLKVTKGHLFKVLTEERESQSLKAGYAALVAELNKEGGRS